MKSSNNSANKIITIFISYCHANNKLAEKLESDLDAVGIKVIRDAHELKYTNSIKEFMKQIRDADYAILLISNEYLRSVNCLFEVDQLLKEKDAWGKILPVLAANTKIYDIKDRITLIKFWNTKVKELETELEGIDPLYTLSSLQQLKETKNILSLVDEFMTRILDTFHLSFEQLTLGSYRPLFEKIGFSQETDFLSDLIEITKMQNLVLKSKALDKHILVYGPSTYYHAVRGTVHWGEHNYESTIISYEEALRLNPLNQTALNNLAFLYMDKFHNYDKALNYLTKVVKINPKFIEARLNIGVVYRNLGQLEKAIYHFEYVLKIEPTNSKAHSNLGNIYKLPPYTDKDKSRYHYEIAIKSDPRFINALIGYANLLKVYYKEIELGNKYYLKALELDLEGIYSDYIKVAMKNTKV